MKKRLSCFLGLAMHIVSFAQTDVNYFEIIREDSVHLYLDAHTMFTAVHPSFTGKECATGYRAIRITAEGKFHGPFRDYSVDKKSGQTFLLAEGNYENGSKEGKFNFYNGSAQPIATGQFLNNAPVGEWKYFSEEGTLLLVLRLSVGSDPKIEYIFNTATQKVIVEHGNGDAVFLSRGSIPYLVRGKVVNGMPDGEWVGEIEAFSGGKVTKRFRKERFKNGKMHSGTLDDGTKRTKICCTSELNQLFQIPEIEDCLNLERFPIKPCEKPVAIPGVSRTTPRRSAKPVSDLSNFESSVRSTIKSKYEESLVGESINRTGIDSEENKMMISFNTDDKGNPIQVKLVSGYGREFFMPIRIALESQTTWVPNQTGLVLSLYVRMSPQTYSYRIEFSIQ